MSTYNNSGARHRAVPRPVTASATAALTLTVAAMFAGAGFAVAAPGQPGVTTEVPEGQPSVTAPSPSAPQADSGTTADWKYVGPYVPPAEYQNAPTRSVPSYNAPVYYSEPIIDSTPTPSDPEPEATPAPEARQDEQSVAPGTPVAPIQAPENTVRFGAISGEKPGWLSQDDADRVNNTAAVLEAQGATYFNNLGIPTTRSDRMAAGTTAGVLIGGTASAVTTYAVVAPAAILAGGLIGGTIGGITGAGVGSVLIPGVGAVPVGVAATAGGAAIGAAAGAAAALIPAAGVGAAGAVIGGVIGGAYGAGENLGEAPAPAPAPELAPVAPAAPVWTPPEAAQLAPAHPLEVREIVAAQPGGADVLAAADGAAAQATSLLNQVVPAGWHL
ncbi:hypothetical protein CH267_00245 [Rhodococcus sp. 06-621-2]|nr:hypothetical protein [Rhodococcus sp. 06-621-2]OZC62822.1 hypothetical protein CH267_00245 [Rhodococcus sp. 06-621-2]